MLSFQRLLVLTVLALGHGRLLIISNNHYHLNKPTHSISAHLIRSLQSNEIIIRSFKLLNSDIFQLDLLTMP